MCDGCYVTASSRPLDMTNNIDNCRNFEICMTIIIVSVNDELAAGKFHETVPINCFVCCYRYLSGKVVSYTPVGM